MPFDKRDAKDLIGFRHPEWREHQRLWRFLADSLEGGERYKYADYAIDPTFYDRLRVNAQPWYEVNIDPLTSEPINIFYMRIVNRNLVPHLSETGSDGRAVYAQRLHRTPVPQMVERAIDCHLAKVYAREVTREGPPLLQQWWEDVDGRGTPVDRWLRETVAPLFLVLGQLDVLFDHPLPPDRAYVISRADQAAYGLDRCVASIVLPENVIWWRLDRRGGYEEVLIHERTEGGPLYQHWTAEQCVTYDRDGEIVASRKHPFGRVPIVRVFDRRLTRCAHVGRSRYALLASLQKAVYNSTSELILSDVLQSHAQLMLPEEYCADEKHMVGPDRALPMKKLIGASGFVSGYQAPQYLDPPKGAQQELRQHIIDFKDDADRHAALQKPAGQTQGATVAQSGISKVMDSQDGNMMLTDLANSLRAAEERLAEFALIVLNDGAVRPALLDQIAINYPGQFDLFTLSDLAQVGDDLQRFIAGAGALPETESEIVKRMITNALPGLPNDRLEELHEEAAEAVRQAVAEPEPEPESRPLPIDPTDLNPALSLEGAAAG